MVLIVDWLSMLRLIIAILPVVRGSGWGLCIMPGHAVGSVLKRAASSAPEWEARSVQFHVEYGHVARKGKEMGSNNRAYRRVEMDQCGFTLPFGLRAIREEEEVKI